MYSMLQKGNYKRKIVKLYLSKHYSKTDINTYLKGGKVEWIEYMIPTLESNKQNAAKPTSVLDIEYNIREINKLYAWVQENQTLGNEL